MKFSHPLMHNNFSPSDMKGAIQLLRKRNPVLTQSRYVREFENKWSKWLKVKYSVFVNSGSSANILTMSILKILYSKGEIILPTLTWVSDVNAVILNDFKPVFVDINPRNLCMDENEIFKKVNKNTLAVFMTHAQGFNGLSNKLLKFLRKKKIILIEDVCESHGATFNKKKLGSFGKISNFSFYYAHHMSTIEGGMICTNDKKIYQIARILRSHGMAREIGNQIDEKKIVKKYPKLSPKFIFLYPAYNFRNNEINATIGINQLKSLDKNNNIRRKNFSTFLSNLNQSLYQTNYKLDGSCNYAFPVILKEKNFRLRDRLELTLKKNNIEFRRGNAGGGNQLRQPYLKKYIRKIDYSKYKNVEHVHNFGYYIGNYPSLQSDKIKKICSILNSI